MNDTMNVQDLFNERIEQNKRIEELVNIVEKLSLALKSAEDKIDKIKEYIEKQTICMKEGNILLELNIDYLLNILNGGKDK